MIEPFMSKALPIAVAVVLGGLYLYIMQLNIRPQKLDVKKCFSNSKNQLCAWVWSCTPPELDTKAFVQGIHDARSQVLILKKI